MNFMNVAIEAAKKSGIDLPVGCVIECNGEIIATTFNQKEFLNDATAHAEILAIKEASKKLGNWRLNGCKMFVTLEPCPMCMWAILNSRIGELYFGAYDFTYGAAGSKLDLTPLLASKIKIFGGIQESVCEKLLKNYFLDLRK